MVAVWYYAALGCCPRLGIIAAGSVVWRRTSVWALAESVRGRLLVVVLLLVVCVRDRWAGHAGERLGPVWIRV